jgi:hypothetical protein
MPNACQRTAQPEPRVATPSFQRYDGRGYSLTNMGPIALFDKSFLQSLALDESTWFDNFFYPTICPLFYVETLADLSKARDELRQARSQ